MPSNHDDPTYITVGRVLKTYGLLGWVKVEALTTNPHRYRKGGTFVLEGKEKGERLVLEEVREEPGVLLVKFRGLESREQARELAGRLLLVTAEELGDSPLDSFWEHQLLGLKVHTQQGGYLGEVTEVMETGANDVLVVKGEKEHLIPMIVDVVMSIDLEKEMITVKPLPGLLEE